MKKETENAIAKYNSKVIPMPISNITFSRILKLENNESAFLLYAAYCDLVMFYEDAEIWATTGFMCERLKMNERKFSKAKKALLELKLIKDIRKRNTENTGFGKCYIKVNFIFKSNQNVPLQNQRGTKEQDKYLIPTNTISTKFQTDILNNNTPREGKIIRKRRGLETTNNESKLLHEIELLTKQNEELRLEWNKITNTKERQQPVQLELFSKEGLITENNFDEFYEMYPKHKSIGIARESWKKLCTSPLLKKVRPEWKVIKHAVLAQKQSEQWQDLKYVPNPANWIKGELWNDAIVKSTFKQNTFTKPNNSNSSVRLDRCGIPMPEIDSSTKNKEYIDNIEKNKKYLERFDKLHNIKPNRK